MWVSDLPKTLLLAVKVPPVSLLSWWLYIAEGKGAEACQVADVGRGKVTELHCSVGGEEERLHLHFPHLTETLVMFLGA